MHDTRPFCVALYYVDLPQVDHGGGEGAVEGARDPSDEVASGRLVSLAGI
jgi:hypothetical protein